LQCDWVGNRLHILARVDFAPAGNDPNAERRRVSFSDEADIAILSLNWPFRRDLLESVQALYVQRENVGMREVSKRKRLILDRCQRATVLREVAPAVRMMRELNLV
jgi:hypothetical protein